MDKIHAFGHVIPMVSVWCLLPSAPELCVSIPFVHYSPTIQAALGAQPTYCDRCVPDNGALRSVMHWVWFLKSPGWFEKKSFLYARMSSESSVFIWDGTEWFLLRAQISFTVRQLLYYFLSITYIHTYPGRCQWKHTRALMHLLGLLMGPASTLSPSLTPGNAAKTS